MSDWADVVGFVCSGEARVTGGSMRMYDCGSPVGLVDRIPRRIGGVKHGERAD